MRKATPGKPWRETINRWDLINEAKRGEMRECRAAEPGATPSYRIEYHPDARPPGPSSTALGWVWSREAAEQIARRSDRVRAVHEPTGATYCLPCEGRRTGASMVWREAVRAGARWT